MPLFRVGSLQRRWRHFRSPRRVQTENTHKEASERRKGKQSLLLSLLQSCGWRPIHRQRVAERSHLENAACQWEGTYTMPHSRTYQSSVRPCCAVRFIWVRKRWARRWMQPACLPACARWARSDLWSHFEAALRTGRRRRSGSDDLWIISP